MKILITGGAGFIGSNLVRLLMNETNFELVVVDKLTYAGNLDSLTEFLDDGRFTFSQTDICDEVALNKVFAEHQPTSVMHLAAESHVDRSIDGPAEFIRTNLVGTFNLLEATRTFWVTKPSSIARRESSPAGNHKMPSSGQGESNHQSNLSLGSEESESRFLHVSTDEVYGSLGPEDPAFTETTPYDPHSPYSASKAGSDHLARAWYATYGLPVIVTNCSNNYGPFQFPEKLVPVVILKALRGESIPVYGTGENVRDWLYVEDHTRALLRVLQAGKPGETYNIGGQNEQRNIDLVRRICGLLDELSPRADGTSYQSQIAFVEDRPGHDQRYGIDSTKITRDLKWTTQENVDSGFRKTVSWYLKNGAWTDRVLSGKYRLERLGHESVSGQ